MRLLTERSAACALAGLWMPADAPRCWRASWVIFVKTPIIRLTRFGHDSPGSKIGIAMIGANAFRIILEPAGPDAPGQPIASWDAAGGFGSSRSAAAMSVPAWFMIDVFSSCRRARALA